VASEKTWSHGTAFVMEEHRLERLESEEDFTAAGPRAGSPEPQQLTDMRMIATGAQPSGSDIEVRTQRGGYAAATEGAGGVWRHTGDTLWYGYEPANVQRGREVISWQDGIGTLKGTTNVHGAALRDGTEVVAYDYEDTAVPAERYGVRVQRRTAGIWQPPTQVYAQASQFSIQSAPAQHYPCLLLLPNNRLMLYFCVYTTQGTATLTQVRVMYSDDGGETWASGVDFGLGESVDSTAAIGSKVVRLTAAYNNGQVSLFAHATLDGALSVDVRDILIQWVSTDLGQTFTEVDRQDGLDSSGGGTGGGCFPTAVPWAQGFAVVFVELGAINPWVASPPAFRPYMVFLGSASQALTEAIANDQYSSVAPLGTFADVGGSPSLVDSGECTAAVDDIGDIYVWGMDPDSDNGGEAFVSRDLGETFKALGLGASPNAGGRWWDDNGDSYPVRISAYWNEARAVIVSNHSSTVQNYDDSATALYLGGWSTVVMPSLAFFAALEQRAAFDTRAWVPWELPQNAGWATAGAGPIGTITGAGVLAISTSGNSRSWNYTGGTPSSANNGMIGECEVTVVSGGSLVADEIAMSFIAQDASNSYGILCRFTSTTMRITNAFGGAFIADIADVPPSTGIRVRCAVADGQYAVWYRTAGTEAGEPWALAASGSMPTSGPALAGNIVSFGHFASSTATTEWTYAAIVDGSQVINGIPLTGTQLAQGQANPADLLDRTYASTAVGRTYITDGVSVSVADGPTIRGDQWRIRPREEYRLDNAISQRSPRISHRTTGLDTSVYAFRWNSDAEVPPSELFCLGLYNCNWPRVTVEFEEAGGYAAPLVVNLYEGLEVAYTRQGSEVHPDSGGTDTPYLREAELQGAYIALTDTVDPTVGQRITRQVAGKWTTATTRQAWMSLDGNTGANTATNGRIVTPSHMLIIPIRRDSIPVNEYKGVRITVTAPAVNADPRPPEDYWEIGRLFVGWAVPFAEPPSWGRSITLEHGQEVVEQEDATFRTYTNSPPQRIVRVGWVDGDDQTKVTGDAANPDYILADDGTGAEPIAVAGGSLQTYDGLYRFNPGPGRDIGYVERLDRLGASDTHLLLNRRHQHMLARIDSVQRIDAPQGEEAEDEVWRGQEIVLVETV